MASLDDRIRRLVGDVPDASPARPQQRRVEIMISGPLNRVGVVRQSLDDLQRRLLSEASRNGDSLQLRVTAFLDDCRHTTPWSNRPVDAGASTNRWHCFRGQTKPGGNAPCITAVRARSSPEAPWNTLFAQAFEHSRNERERIDAIIMFGDRFDDAPGPTLQIAGRLRERGTKIFAFHVGKDRASRFAYEQLAQQGGGVSVQLTDERAFASVLPVITDYLFRPAETLRALPAAPNNPDVKALVDRLKALPAPAAAPSMPIPALSKPALAIKLPPLPPPVAAVAAAPWGRRPAKKV